MEWGCQRKLALKRVVMVRKWDIRNLHLVGGSVIGVTKSREWPNDQSKSSLGLEDQGTKRPGYERIIFMDVEVSNDLAEVVVEKQSEIQMLKSSMNAGE